MHETRCHKTLREIVSFILCLMFLLPPIYEHFDNHKYLKLGAQITLINSVKRKKSWFSFLKLFLYRRFLLKKIVIVYIPLSNIYASFVHIYRYVFSYIYIYKLFSSVFLEQSTAEPDWAEIYTIQFKPVFWSVETFSNLKKSRTKKIVGFFVYWI